MLHKIGSDEKPNGEIEYFLYVTDEKGNKVKTSLSFSSLRFFKMYIEDNKVIFKPVRNGYESGEVEFYQVCNKSGKVHLDYALCLARNKNLLKSFEAEGYILKEVKPKVKKSLIDWLRGL